MIDKKDLENKLISLIGNNNYPVLNYKKYQDVMIEYIVQFKNKSGADADIKYDKDKVEDYHLVVSLLHILFMSA